jgi:hypothetical protein
MEFVSTAGLVLVGLFCIVWFVSAVHIYRDMREWGFSRPRRAFLANLLSLLLPFGIAFFVWPRVRDWVYDYGKWQYPNIADPSCRLSRNDLRGLLVAAGQRRAVTPRHESVESVSSGRPEARRCRALPGGDWDRRGSHGELT